MRIFIFRFIAENVQIFVDFRPCGTPNALYLDPQLGACMLVIKARRNLSDLMIHDRSHQAPTPQCGRAANKNTSYLYRGKRPYYAHQTGKRILWPNHWLHGDKTLAGYRLDNCLSMPKYKSVLSLQHFRQYRFSGGSAFVRNREQMPQ